MYKDMFPARLTQLQTQKKVSARDMSLSIGQNPGSVNNIETWKALPSMAGFFYICEYLGVTPQEFFDTNSKQPAELRPFIEKGKETFTNAIREHRDRGYRIPEAVKSTD